MGSMVRYVTMPLGQWLEMFRDIDIDFGDLEPDTHIIKFKYK